MDVSSRGHRVHARQHDLRHIESVWYAPIQLCEAFFITVQFIISSITLSIFFLVVRRRPQVDLKEFNFLEKNFAKTKPEERTWAKLVTLDTIHWYCDGPKPTPADIKYDARIHQRKFVVPILLEWFLFSFIFD